MKDHPASHNMTIVAETPTQITLACHCGHQFDCELNGDRPKCPNCECYWRDERWELNRRLDALDHRKAKFYQMSTYFKGDSQEKRNRIIGSAYTMAEFVMRNLDTLDFLKDNVRVQFTQLTREEYMEECLNQQDTTRDMVFDVLSTLLRGRKDDEDSGKRDRDRERKGQRERTRDN